MTLPVCDLREAYSSIQDIDLFTGGLAEVPTKGAVVGSTFACLLGRQFFYYKTGDRRVILSPFSSLNLLEEMWMMIYLIYLNFTIVSFQVLVRERHPSLQLQQGAAERDPESHLGPRGLRERRLH